MLELKVVEVRAGTGVLGSTICTALPGMLLADAGADVALVSFEETSRDLDARLGTLVTWDRGKRRLQTGPSPEAASSACVDAITAADLVLYCGPRDSDLFRTLRTANTFAPWVVVQCDDSDLEILVQARSGLTSLMSGPTGGPTFSAIPMAGYGTALAVYTAALAAVLGGSRTDAEVLDFEITLSEGLTGTQAMLLRDADSPRVPLGPLPLRNFLYQCKGGEWIHLNLMQPASRISFFRILGELGWTPVGEVIDGNDQDQIDSISALLLSVPVAELLARLVRARIPAQQVVAPLDALQDPELETLGLAGPAGPDGRRWLERASLVQPRGGASSPVRQVHPSEPQDRIRLPLEGVKVLDCGAYLAGPYGGFVLSQFGARVVKLEPTSGDPVRVMPEIFATCNAGKESVTIDFSDPSATQTLRTLVGWADVVHHNNRSSTVARLGLDPETCFAYNPGLVYSQITAFGSRGSRSDQPGFDQTFQAATGSEVLIGGPAGPLWHPSSFCDIAAGWIAAASIIQALLLRRTGVEGVEVETPAIAAGLFGVSLVSPAASIELGLNRELTGWGPGYSLYRCRDDRWVAVAVLSVTAWAELATLVPGMPDQFVALDRDTIGTRAQAALARFASGISAREFEALVRDAGGRAEVAAGEVRAQPLSSHGESYLAEHISQLGPGVRLELWDPDAGRVGVARAPGRWRARRTGVTVAPRTVTLPGTGEHSAPVLDELSHDAV